MGERHRGRLGPGDFSFIIPGGKSSIGMRTQAVLATLNNTMKSQLSSTSKLILPVFASLSLFVGVPITSQAYEDNPAVKKVKVKDHKIKVKTVGGKAKIKDKASGKQKAKIKGWNGELAAAIADEIVAGSQGYGK